MRDRESEGGGENKACACSKTLPPPPLLLLLLLAPPHNLTPAPSGTTSKSLQGPITKLRENMEIMICALCAEAASGSWRSCKVSLKTISLAAACCCAARDRKLVHSQLHIQEQLSEHLGPEL